MNRYDLIWNAVKIQVKFIIIVEPNAAIISMNFYRSLINFEHIYNSNINVYFLDF